MQPHERDRSRSRVRGYPALLIGLVTFTTGIGAGAGSMLGAGVGRTIQGTQSPTGLIAGALIGGIVGVALGVWAAAGIGAIRRSRMQSWAAFIGGVLGFFLAAAIATRNLGGPLIPIASTLLAGVGAAIGSAVAARKARVG
jgi:hypothetical protein